MKRSYPFGSMLLSLENLYNTDSRVQVFNAECQVKWSRLLAPREVFKPIDFLLPEDGWIECAPDIQTEFYIPQDGAPTYFCNACSTERVPSVGVVCDRCRSAPAAKEGRVYDGIETVIAHLKDIAKGDTIGSRDVLNTLCRDAAHYLQNYWKKLGKEEAVTNVPHDVDAVIAERGKVYGDPSQSHANIGLEWTGLIQQHYGLKLDHPLPGWLVELMMVVFKCHRAARVFHQDNYTDAKAYLSFAEKDQQTPQ